MPFGKIVLGLMLVSIIVGAHHPAWSQQFPYAAPQAPEFDDRGNLRGPGQTEVEPPQPVITPSSPKRERAYTQPQPQPQPQQQPRPQQQPQPQYGVVTPYAPEIGVPSAPAPPSQSAPPPQQRPAPVHRAGPQSPPRQGYPPAQTQERPDCSQYPMLIARARSEPEMQMTARQYLTCLLKSGWGMEQARAHVISTIESTFRLTR